MTQLDWLPAFPDWRQRLKALPADPAAAWEAAVGLANSATSILSKPMPWTKRCAASLLRRRRRLPASPRGWRCWARRRCITFERPFVSAGLRRGIFVEVYENEYGQYLQELSDKDSALYAFKPNCILLSLDAYHLTAGVHAAAGKAELDRLLDDTKARIRNLWRLAKENFRCPGHSSNNAAGPSSPAGTKRTSAGRLARGLCCEAQRRGADDGRRGRRRSSGG